MRRPLSLLIGALLVAGPVLGVPAPPASGRPGPTSGYAAAARAGALPDHFGIGLSAQPADPNLTGWMPGTGIPWDFAYQYLSGGVNTGHGWQTWIQNGRYPLWYAQTAQRHGYIPVFPYYMLVQSTGPCDGCTHAQRDLANLNTPTIMRAYFADFAKLMQRLGPRTFDGIKGYGGTAIVHIEPDLSGYAEHAVLKDDDCYGHCTGGDNDPGNLRAAVASTGFPAVQGYSNTYRGFNAALLHLRDRYAPNVLLAFHVSDWAGQFDIGSEARAGDPAALGRRVASFANAAGVRQARKDTSSYDLLFNDVADRDSGVTGIWWDRLNRTFPNFRRWERYIGTIHTATARPVVVWQIPEGNQWFRTVDGSGGHSQDNRAEYFFQHIPELKAVGIVALLFGRGNPSTTHTDDKGDGVTNPPWFCTSNGVSSGRVCNDHAAQWPDDDGGYLRIQAQAYYRDPLPLEAPGPFGSSHPG